MAQQQRVPIRALLQHMIDHNATDIYLSPTAAAKMTMQGNFVDATAAPLSDEDTIAYAKELMKQSEVEEFEREKEINISYQFNEQARFRVNIYTQRDYVNLVIRRIAVQIPALEELGLPQTMGELVMQDRGLILVTGATGSGKSTSVAAMIDYRNTRVGGHIITIEDPIEFIHPNKMSLVSQREVGIDTRSFHVALKNTLRQAPKVIYIGEIRDTDTMGFAMHAAETGHLVLATLHSNNSYQTLERILNFFDREYHEQLLLQLSLNLRAIISQRLVRKVGGGRIAALEVMLNTPTISELVQKGDIKGVRGAIASSTKQGLQTFDMHLHQLWANGLISEEEAFKNADSSNNLRLRMRGVAMVGA